MSGPWSIQLCRIGLKLQNVTVGNGRLWNKNKPWSTDTEYFSTATVPFTFLTICFWLSTLSLPSSKKFFLLCQTDIGEIWLLGVKGSNLPEHNTYSAVSWTPGLTVSCSMEEVVLGIIDKLKCQVARPFTRDKKNPDPSGTRTHEDTCPVRYRLSYGVRNIGRWYRCYLG